MATLTSTQRTDMQADLAIGAAEDVFTNDELDRLYTRASSDYNTAVYLAWRQLLADTTKFHNYTAGNTRMEREAIFQHVKEMVKFWSDESRATTNQMVVAGLLDIPTRHKEKPGEPKDKRSIYELNRGL